MSHFSKPPDEWIQRMVEEARRLGEARMLRDDQELTPEITEIIFKRLRAFLQRAERSEAWAAKALGISPTTLSQVLNGNYQGDTEGQIRRIDKWLEIQIAREAAPRPNGFVKTQTAMTIIGTAKMINQIGGIAVVHGPSGIGKTMTAEYIRSENPGSIYIRMTTAGATKTAVYDAIGRQLRLGGMKLSAYQMELMVVEQLKEKNRLIIIDEVHKLVFRKNHQEGLDVLRDLHDQTDCPMLWLGTAEIRDYIVEYRNHREPVEQIYGRVAWWLDLTSIANRADGGPGCHCVEDIRKLMAANNMRITPDSESYLLGIATEPRMGGLRTVMRLCQMAMKKAGSRAITVEMLMDFQRERLGSFAAQLVEKKMQTRVAKAG